MNKENRLSLELEKNVLEIKQQLKRKQSPKKNAPIVPIDLLITLSGCAFLVHEQSNGNLVLITCDKTNFDNNVNIVRACTYITGAYDAVSIYGWDWRPMRFRRNKLFLRAIAPTDLGVKCEQSDEPKFKVKPQIIPNTSLFV